MKRLVTALLALAAGCSPALDWREARPESAGLVALFPCKPERLTREVALAEARVAMQVLACAADGSTWGVSTADMVDPRQVGPALAALRAARTQNLGGTESELRPAQVPGMTPQPAAVRFVVSGRRPDGSAIVEHAAVFARGTRVFHAAVLGGQPAAQALETFFGGLTLAP